MKKKSQSIDPQSKLIMDAILDDDVSALLSVITVPDIPFRSNYQLPELLRNDPPLISVCCYFASVDCFRALIDMNADISLKDSIGVPISYFAAFGGSIEIARELYNSNVDFGYELTLNSMTVSPMCYAVMNGNIDFIKWLWFKGFESGESSLIYACSYGQDETLRFFIENTETQNYLDALIDSLFFVAVANGNDHIFSYLVNYGTPSDPETLATTSGENGSIECLKQLLKIFPSNNDIPVAAFFSACKFGHLDIVLYLINLSIQIGVDSNHKVSPLFLAVSHNFYEIAKILIENGYVNGVTESPKAYFFLKANSEPEIPEIQQISNSNRAEIDRILDGTGHTSKYSDFEENPENLLQIAIRNKNFDIEKLIVDSFNPTLNGSILRIAIDLSQYDLIIYLFNSGFEIKNEWMVKIFESNHKRLDSQSKAQIAEIKDLLISKGILEDHILYLLLVENGDIESLDQLITSYHTIFDEAFINKYSLLKSSIQTEQYKMAIYLVEHFNVMINDTYLFNLEITEDLYCELVQVFLDHGMKLTSPKNGKSLLFYAIGKYYYRLINLLKENGADFQSVAIPFDSFDEPKSLVILDDMVKAGNDLMLWVPQITGIKDLTIKLVDRRNIILLKYLLDIGFITNINTMHDDKKRSLLDLALINCDTDMMILLLERGALIENSKNNISRFIEYANEEEDQYLLQLLSQQKKMLYSLESD